MTSAVSDRLTRQGLRYAVKGGGSMAVNLAVMVGLTDGLGVPPEVAAGLSTALVLILGYQLMTWFVFPDGDAMTHRRRLPSYVAVILAGKGVNYVLFLTLLSVGVWYPAAWVGGAVVVFGGTFAANRRIWGVSHAA